MWIFCLHHQPMDCEFHLASLFYQNLCPQYPFVKCGFSDNEPSPLLSANTNTPVDAIFVLIFVAWFLQKSIPCWLWCSMSLLCTNATTAACVRTFQDVFHKWQACSIYVRVCFQENLPTQLCFVHHVSS